MNPQMKSQNVTCQNSGKSKYCTGEFEITPDDFTFYEKIKVPPPTFCPTCRSQRRMLFRNFKTLYTRKSDLGGETIISMYHKDQLFPVYSNSEWWSDKWDPITYGVNFDFTKTFTENFSRINNTVPRFQLFVTKSIDCEYTNATVGSKNCYMAFGCLNSETCSYGHPIWDSRDSVDNVYLFKSENCYECIDVVASNNLLFSQECESCADSSFLYDCKSCINCIGCVGLRQKTYHIFNQPVTREEFNNFKNTFPLYKKESIEYIQEKVSTLKNSLPVSALFGSRNNTVSGNHIYNSQNVLHSFDIKAGENSKFGYTVRKFVNSYDVSFTSEIESSYESLFSTGSNLFFCSSVLDSAFVYYSQFCFNCTEVFGCIGLRKKSYCILNVQYTKEEYFFLKEKIIAYMQSTKEWGEHFDTSLSPFGYNEAITHEYLPLSKDEIELAQYKYIENTSFPYGQSNIGDVPSNPSEYVIESLKNKIADCKKCTRSFRLVENEILYYKTHALSLPEFCFQCRFAEKMSKRDIRTLMQDACDLCGKLFLTSHSRLENKIIYCEDCYKREVL